LVMRPLEIKFLADVMLGRLSKWLRIMGYDTHYQPFYNGVAIDFIMKEGCLLLTRNKRLVNKYIPSYLINSEHVGTQLQEMAKSGYLHLDRSQWFSRCLVCNTHLQSISPEEAKAHIPEYIFTQNISGLHFCPSCGRYFWPGSHKTRMMSQISKWLSEDG
jgi:uncharacterized protein with PIN domain